MWSLARLANGKQKKTKQNKMETRGQDKKFTEALSDLCGPENTVDNM